MKTRNGFVSNSSSSSFIIVIAKVVNKDKLVGWLESLKLDKYDYDICKVSEASQRYWYSCDKNNIIVNSFNGDSVKLDKSLLKEDDDILVISIANDEGDCGIFSGYDEYTNKYVDIDYDISLRDLPSKQVELYNGLGENNGLTSVDKTYGAGRNG